LINIDSDNGKQLWFCNIDYIIPVQLFKVFKLLGSFNINFVNVGLFETKYILCERKSNLIFQQHSNSNYSFQLSEWSMVLNICCWRNWEKKNSSFYYKYNCDWLRTEAGKNGIFTFSIPGSSITLSKLYPELVCLRLRNSFVNIVRRSDHTTGGKGVHTSKGGGGYKEGALSRKLSKN
jgi:hypothetical protein